MTPSGKAVSTAGLTRNSSNPWVDRVYLIDDHPFFASALATLIRAEADLSVCGMGHDSAKIIADAAQLSPDIMVLDVNLSAKNNWALAIELRKISKAVPFLFVSSLQNPRAEAGLKWLEPCNFVEKARDPADIIQAIRATLAKLRHYQSLHPTSSPASKREIQRE
jgi:DNA-binding NarL/FixJ family response regulator